MSTPFYDLASLVLVPSGYKTSKVYAQKPLTTDGQLAFTRASTATRVGPDGLIEKVRTNLVLQSEAFNTTWGAVNVSVSANTTANPLDGVVNADTITLTGGTDTKRVQQSLVHTGNFTQSIFLKAGTHQFIQLLIGTDVVPVANFDLVNGTTSASGATSQIISLGNGWFRCSMSYTSTTATDVYLWAVDSLAAGRAASTASTGTFFAFGFQLETGDIATPYIPTTTAAVSVGMLANVPRLDYLNSSCPRLLLEPQRTNLVFFSEQLNTGSGGTSAVTANTQVSPDGYTNADTIGAGYWTKSTSQAAGTYTLSVFAKYQSAATILLYIYNGAYYQGSFNLQTGVATSSTGSPSVSMVSYGNGWYRCIVTATTASTISEVGFGSGNFYGYGLQLEAGAYATSYIPTLGAAVTRSADAASKTGISALIGQTEGTLFVDVNITKLVDSEAIITINSGGYANNVTIQRVNAVIQFVRNSATQSGASVVNSSSITTGRHKMAIAYKNGDTAFFLDGVQVSTTQTQTFTNGTLSVLAITGDAIGAIPFSDSYNQALLFKTRLTNAQLAELTA